MKLVSKLTYYLLWLTIFTVPFQKSFIIPGLGSLNKLAGLVLVGVVLLGIVLRGFIRKPPKFYLLVIIFIILNLSSYFWAESSNSALDKSMLLLQLGFLAWAIFEFATSKRKLDGLFKAYVLGCTVIALQSIYLFFTSNIVVTDSRFFVEGYNPNALAITWSLGLPMAIYLIVNKSKYILLYIPVALFAILLTGSRTGFILLMFVALSTIWYLFKYQIKFRKLILVITTLFVLMISQQLPEAQVSRLLTLEDELSSGSLNGRTGVWESGLETFKGSPIFGVGSGSFLVASVINSESGIGLSAHNSYLSILVENGIVGFLIFIVILIMMIVYSMRMTKNNPYRWLNITLIIMWLILSFASHAEAQKYTWIIFGMIVASRFIEVNNIEPPIKVTIQKYKSLVWKRLVWMRNTRGQNFGTKFNN